jgi:hypothetical protein
MSFEKFENPQEETEPEAGAQLENNRETLRDALALCTSLEEVAQALEQAAGGSDRFITNSGEDIHVPTTLEYIRSGDKEKASYIYDADVRKKVEELLTSQERDPEALWQQALDSANTAEELIDAIKLAPDGKVKLFSGHVLSADEIVNNVLSHGVEPKAIVNWASSVAHGGIQAAAMRIGQRLEQE